MFSANVSQIVNIKCVGSKYVTKKIWSLFDHTSFKVSIIWSPHLLIFSASFMLFDALDIGYTFCEELSTSTLQWLMQMENHTRRRSLLPPSPPTGPRSTPWPRTTPPRAIPLVQSSPAPWTLYTGKQFERQLQFRLPSVAREY